MGLVTQVLSSFGLDTPTPGPGSDASTSPGGDDLAGGLGEALPGSLGGSLPVDLPAGFRDLPADLGDIAPVDLPVDLGGVLPVELPAGVEEPVDEVPGPTEGPGENIEQPEPGTANPPALAGGSGDRGGEFDGSGDPAPAAPGVWAQMTGLDPSNHRGLDVQSGGWRPRPVGFATPNTQDWQPQAWQPGTWLGADPTTGVGGYVGELTRAVMTAAHTTGSSPPARLPGPAGGSAPVLAGGVGSGVPGGGLGGGWRGDLPATGHDQPTTLLTSGGADLDGAHAAAGHQERMSWLAAAHGFHDPDNASTDPTSSNTNTSSGAVGGAGGQAWLTGTGMAVPTRDGGTLTLTPTTRSPHARTTPDLAQGRYLIHIDNPAAPGSYGFELGMPAGARAVVNTAGGVDITNTRGQVVQTIAAPWATDAHGRDLPTRFQISTSPDGATVLTQHVGFDEHTAFPVLADPDVGTSPGGPDQANAGAEAAGGGGDGDGGTDGGGGDGAGVEDGATGGGGDGAADEGATGGGAAEEGATGGDGAEEGATGGGDELTESATGGDGAEEGATDGVDGVEGVNDAEEGTEGAGGGEGAGLADAGEHGVRADAGVVGSGSGVGGPADGAAGGEEGLAGGSAADLAAAFEHVPASNSAVGDPLAADRGAEKPPVPGPAAPAVAASLGVIPPPGSGGPQPDPPGDGTTPAPSSSSWPGWLADAAGAVRDGIERILGFVTPPAPPVPPGPGGSGPDPGGTGPTAGPTVEPGLVDKFVGAVRSAVDAIGGLLSGSGSGFSPEEAGPGASATPEREPGLVEKLFDDVRSGLGTALDGVGSGFDLAKAALDSVDNWFEPPAAAPDPGKPVTGLLDGLDATIEGAIEDVTGWSPDGNPLWEIRNRTARALLGGLLDGPVADGRDAGFDPDAASDAFWNRVETGGLAGVFGDLWNTPARPPPRPSPRPLTRSTKSSVDASSNPLPPRAWVPSPLA